MNEDFPPCPYCEHPMLVLDTAASVAECHMCEACKGATVTPFAYPDEIEINIGFSDEDTR